MSKCHDLILLAMACGKRPRADYEMGQNLGNQHEPDTYDFGNALFEWSPIPRNCTTRKP